MEKIKIPNPLEVVKNVGGFALSRILGGAWSQLPPLLNAHEQRKFPLQAANIQYFSTGDDPETLQPGA